MKKKTTKYLRNKLRKIFFDYIKQRDGRTCFTCGRLIEPGKGLHCGHFIPSKICGYDLRYDEEIVHVQCYFCNINLGGYGAMYYKKMIEKYGQKKVDNIFERLNIYKQQRNKWKDIDYINKIQYYKDLQNKQ